MDVLDLCVFNVYFDFDFQSKSAHLDFLKPGLCQELFGGLNRMEG